MVDGRLQPDEIATLAKASKYSRSVSSDKSFSITTLLGSRTQNFPGNDLQAEVRCFRSIFGFNISLRLSVETATLKDKFGKPTVHVQGPQPSSIALYARKRILQKSILLFAE